MKIFSLKNKTILIFLGTILLIGLWEVSAILINNDIYLPRIEEVFSSILEILNHKDFILNITSSMVRTSISFALALFIAIFVGILSKIISPLNDILKPFNAIIKTMPTMILVVLALIWFDKDKTPYIVGTFIVIPIFYEGVLSALSNVDYKLLDMCKIYGIKRKEKITKIYIPIIIFYIAKNFVATFSLAFKVVIAGEVHGQPKYGIGSAVQNAKANFEVSEIFGWIIIIAILSIIFDIFNIYLHKKINKRWGNYEIKPDKNK